MHGAITHVVRRFFFTLLQVVLEPTDHGVRLPVSIEREVLDALAEALSGIIVSPGRWTDDAWKMAKSFPGPAIGDVTFGEVATRVGGGGLPSDTFDPRRFGGLFRMLVLANEGNGHLASHYSDRFDHLENTVGASWMLAWAHGLIKIGGGVTHEGFVTNLENVRIDLVFVAPVDGPATLKNYARLTIEQLRGWAVNIAIEKSGLAVPSFCLDVCKFGLTEARFLWFALLEGLLHYEFEGIIDGVGITLPDASEDVAAAKLAAEGAVAADPSGAVVAEPRSKRSRRSG